MTYYTLTYKEKEEGTARYCISKNRKTIQEYLHL